MFKIRRVACAITHVVMELARSTAKSVAEAAMLTLVLLAAFMSGTLGAIFIWSLLDRDDTRARWSVGAAAVVTLCCWLVASATLIPWFVHMHDGDGASFFSGVAPAVIVTGLLISMALTLTAMIAAFMASSFSTVAGMFRNAMGRCAN